MRERTRPLLVLACLLVPAVSTAQVVAPPAPRAPSDTLEAADGWRNSLVATLTASQAAYDNWQAGGVRSLAAGGRLVGSFDRAIGRAMIYQEMRAILGFVQQDTLEVRKADDELRAAVAVEVGRAGRLQPSASLTVRTQAAAGFDTAPDSVRYPSLTVVPGRALKISAFASPLVLTQTLGATVRPRSGVVLRGGLGSKQTVVGIPRLRPVYGNRPGQAVRVEAGLDALAQYDGPLAPNVRLLARLTAFQALTNAEVDAPDVALETTLTMRVNRTLSVTLDAAAVFDADVSSRAQLKRVLALGLSVPLL